MESKSYQQEQEEQATNIINIIKNANKILIAKKQWQEAILEANKIWAISVSKADKILEDVLGEKIL